MRPTSSARLVLPGHDDFDDARAVFNALIDKRPAAILYCTSEDEVRQGLAYARNKGLKVAVRSSGHNVAGRSIADDAVVLDLSAINGVRVRGSTIEVDGGAIWAQVDRAAAEHGVGITGGTVSSTGVGGLVLNGGIGWLVPSFGLACDNLMSARMVLADGSILEVDDASSPDAMWALRGSGTPLGVVTSFRFSSNPLGTIVAGSIVVALDRLSAWIPALQEILEEPPPSLMAGPSFLYRGGKPVLSLDIAFHRPSRQELAKVQQLDGLPGILRNTVRERDYVSLQRMIDEPDRTGLRSYWRAGYPRRADPDLLLGLADRFSRSPSQHSIIFLENLHGAFPHPPRPSSFPTRQPHLSMMVATTWSDAEDDERNLAWLADLWSMCSAHLRPEAPYANYSSAAPDATDAPRVATLTRIRSSLDPAFLFV